MLHTSQNIALGKFFDNRQSEAGYFFLIRRQASVSNERLRKPQIQHRSEVEIEARRFQFRRDDASAKSQLCQTRSCQLRHRRNGREDLLQPVHAAALMINGYECGDWRSFAKFRCELVDLIKA